MIHTLRQLIANFRSRSNRAAEARQQAQTRELVEPSADTEPPTADPRLTAFLVNGPDEQFERVRQEAIEALGKTDSIAFWFQAVGDGTPLNHARRNSIEQRTPHNALYLSGYDDDFSYPEITQIALQLFAHHACVFTSVPQRRNPADGIEAFEQQGREAIRNTLGLSTTAAEQMYADADSDSESDDEIEDAEDVFEPRLFADQRERAIDVLEREELATFFVQVMTTAELVSLTVPAASEHFSIDEVSDSPIEYFQARPTNADLELAQQLAMETGGQHHYVVAQVLSQPIEAIAEQAVEMALESGYTLEIDSI